METADPLIRRPSFLERASSLLRVPAPRWYPDGMLLLICALAAVPSLYLAFNQFMEYDGFWHVFIGQQDHWQNFWFDYLENDHPPLMYLMLKLVIHLGRSIPIYRSVPMISSLASIYLVGKISQKISVSKFTPFLTALAFASSIGTIELSVSVRAYMLSIVFVLLAFYYFLDMMPGAAVERPARARILFAVSLMLAVSSHYMTFFYVAACGLILAGSALLFWRLLPFRTWIAQCLAFVPAIGAMGYFYFTHIRLHPIAGADYLLSYLYSGNESKPAFVIRNLQSVFNFLAPFPIAGRGNFLIVAGAIAVAGIGLLLLVRSRAVLPLVMQLVLLSELACAGLYNKYPFGGLLRQQYILFPFAVLSAGVCMDRLFTFINLRWLNGGLTVAASAALIVFGVYRWENFPRMSNQLLTAEMNRFETAIPDAKAVYLDQFNLIGFFIHQHQWKWVFERRLAMATDVDEYALERDNRPLTVLRDRTRWNFDFTDPALFHDIAQSMRVAKLGKLAVFCVHQAPEKLTADQQSALREKLIQMAKADHLRFRRFVLDGPNVYAEIESTRGTENRGIQIVSATYGANCGAPAGNVTTETKARCQDDESCSYTVDATVLGDPKRGCKKDFQVVWTCGTGSEVHTAAVPAEAGFGSMVPLSCEAGK